MVQKSCSENLDYFLTVIYTNIDNKRCLFFGVAEDWKKTQQMEGGQREDFLADSIPFHMKRDILIEKLIP